MELTSGHLISEQYEILDSIGRGGFGEVYLARDRKLEREVALKILINDADLISSDFVARFQREIKLCRQLEHPNIVRLYDYGEMQGRPYMVMEFVRGMELGDHLLDHGGVSYIQARRIMLQLLDGLVAAHSLDIVHRDLKPNNLMMTSVGMRADFIKILDFGIAKAVRDAERDTQVTFQTQNQLLGTPSYMSPEQLRQEPVGPTADIYSAGLIFIELLTGQPLLEGTMVEVVARHIDPRPHEMPPEASGSPFASLIAKAVAKQPKDRFSSAREMYKALEQMHLDDATGSVSVVSNGTGPQPAVAASGSNSGPITPAPQDPSRLNTGQVDPQAPDAGSQHRLAAPAGAVSPTTPIDSTEDEKKSPLALVLILMLILVAVGGTVLVMMLMEESDPGGETEPGEETAEAEGAVEDGAAAGATGGAAANSSQANANDGMGTSDPLNGAVGMNPANEGMNAGGAAGTVNGADDGTPASDDTGTDDGTTNGETEASGQDQVENGAGNDEDAASGESPDDESAGEDEDDDKGTDDEEEESRKPRPSRTVSIRFESDPSGATVKLNRRTCRTPCSMKVRRGAKPRARITKRGYQSKSVRVDASRDKEVDVKLYRGL